MIYGDSKPVGVNGVAVAGEDAAVPCAGRRPVAVCDSACCSHGSESLLDDELLECCLDRAHGGEGGFVGVSERSEADGFRVGGLGLDLAVFDAERDEVADHRGLWLSFPVIAAGDDEIEGVAVVGFSVDFYWVGSVHGVWIF